MPTDYIPQMDDRPFRNVSDEILRGCSCDDCAREIFFRAGDRISNTRRIAHDIFCGCSQCVPPSPTYVNDITPGVSEVPRNQTEETNGTFEQLKVIAEYISALEDTIIFGSFPRCVLSGEQTFRDIDILTTAASPYSELLTTLFDVFGPSIGSQSITIQKKENAGGYGNLGVESVATVVFVLLPYLNVMLDIVRPNDLFVGKTPEEYLGDMYKRGDISANFTYIKDGEYLGIGHAMDDAKGKKLRILSSFPGKRLSKLERMLSSGWTIVPSEDD